MANDLDQAREALKTWLGDLEALKSHVDPASPQAKPFNDAWEAALKKAATAAAAYALAANNA